jgi:hypothetical protein
MTDITLAELIAEYKATLSEKELQAWTLAEKLLGMTFQIEKSNGFIQWKQKKYS